MKSMKLTEAESQKTMLGYSAPEPGDGPAYPYGLTLCLNNEVLAKLGMAPLPVGSKVTVMALATVTSVSSNQEQDGDKRENCDLQITDLEITPEAAKSGNFYPNSNMN